MRRYSAHVANRYSHGFFTITSIALVAIAALVGCGGGGGGGSSSGSVPITNPTSPPLSSTPKPTPTPSPTPTPGGSSTTGPGQTLTGPSTYPSINYGVLWGPTAVANAFSFPVQHGWNGSGFTIAVIIDAPFSTSDVQQYTSYFRIPQTSRTISVQDVDGGPLSATDSQEATLDVETIAGLAPGSNIIVYELPDLTYGSIIDALNSIVSNSSANVVNISAGGCESSTGYDSVAPIIQQASNAYIAVVASAGDQGADCSDIPPYQFGVEYPASDPNAIGVGGTETSTILQDPINNPTAWNDNQAAGGMAEATGGGTSTYFLLPSYQNGLSGSYRYVPDVAMPAVQSAVVFNSQWVALNGTSWSAPQVSAMVAELDQFCNSVFQTPVTMFYYADQQAGYNDFIDVTGGNNSWNGSGGYVAGPGFDPVSGIGLPLGMNVASTVCPDRVPVAIVRRASAQSLPVSNRSSTFNPPPLIRKLVDLGQSDAGMPTKVTFVLKPSVANVANEAILLDALKGAGFTIMRQYRNHLVVDAKAPASLIERFFNTSIHDYHQPQYGRRYANSNALFVPSALQGIVGGVVADDLVTLRAQ